MIQQLLIDVTGKPFPDLMQEVVLESNAVLSMAMTKEMMTPRLAGYGFGWWVGGIGARASFSHPGKNASRKK